MVPNGGIWCQMVSKKKEFVREYFVQKFVSYKKHFFLQKETFIKNIFQKTNDKKEIKNEIIKNAFQNNFGCQKIKLKIFR